jgi:hypothetical protein
MCLDKRQLDNDCYDNQTKYGHWGEGKSPGIYLDRVTRGDRDHRDPGG